MVLLAVLAIAAAVVLLIVQPWQGGTQTPVTGPGATSAAPDATVTESTSADPTGAASPTPSETPGIKKCTAAELVVTASTDQEEYGAGENPLLTLTIKNTSKASCTIDVGTSQQVFTITSGADVWWRSTDCQQNPNSHVATVTAGQEVSSSTPVVWDRTRSSVSTCADSTRPQAPGGGASYYLEVSIAGIVSENSVQFFLS